MNYKRIILVILSLAILPLSSCAQAKFNPAEPPAHDPAVIECDGTWYLFSTGWGISVYTSTDRKNWSQARSVFETAPQWALESVPGFKGHIWAPDISFYNGRYYLYYSCSSFGKNDSAIGVASSRTLDPKSPEFGWTDHGCVIRSVGGRDLWNAIDPNLFIDDDGTPWLSFGSFWGGIKLVKMDASLTKVSDEQIWYPLCRRPEGTAEDTARTDDAVKQDKRGADFNPGNGAVEAPFIIKRGPYYYLLVSYDLCCRGPKSTYKVMAGRSEKICGPYIDRNGRAMLEGGGTPVITGNERYPGVGHCAVFRTGEQDLLFFHAYDKQYNYQAHLLVRPLVWSEDGWPVALL